MDGFMEFCAGMLFQRNQDNFWVFPIYLLSKINIPTILQNLIKIVMKT